MKQVIESVFAKPQQFLLTFFAIFSTSFGFLYYFNIYPESSSVQSTSYVTSPEFLLFLGIVSGGLQLIGYITYITDESIDPNPVTWFMFAYGTAILTLLEWDASATFPELFLLIVCSLCGIYVSARCWFHARQNNALYWWPRDWWPEDRYEKASFISDLFITVAYISVWVLLITQSLASVTYDVFILAFLFLSNISTFPAFYPILRSTYLNPESERSAPWLIWTAAYLTMGVIVYLSHETFFTPLMAYPAINLILHAAVGLLAKPLVVQRPLL